MEFNVNYLVRRLSQSLFLLAGVSVLSFVFLELAPGDFFEEMRLNPQIPAETVSSLKHAYSLDQPLPVRYWRWLESVARGEFGFSFAYGSPVAPLIRIRALNTLVLTGTCTALSWAIAVPLGVFSAHRRGSTLDRVCELGTSTILATPDLLLALGLLFLALRTGWFPMGGMSSAVREHYGHWTEAKDASWHLFLPVVALVLSSLPVILKHVRATMLDVLASPYIRAAELQGIRPARVLFRHALPACVNPLISLFSLSLASLLSASLLIEVVMSWPGLGPLLLEAILARDVYVVIGVVMLSTLALVCGCLLGDLLLYAADPRIRHEGAA